ncbi:MAG: hypothetical protein A2W31_00630 [Planctomycetes bacterium RBG_16_64_10]|nr:MAG: hypothetical protein A2W31_00630 [Planctomycetes bacterium RBG_16_64_10]
MGIRQPSAARALVLRQGNAELAILSLDLAAIPGDFARRVQQRVASETGIAPTNVRVCVTHTHSMPAFCYLRQWGAVPTDYMAMVEGKAVDAARLAKADLASAALLIGKSRAVGGNFNRTTADYRTDERFDEHATDEQRWLDTMVHVLFFERAGKGNLLWYHFSAHPVCHADELAGPDWPGLVDQRLKNEFDLTPSYLQGHAGDVNPGAGDPWRGDADRTSEAVHAAVRRAMDDLQRVDVTSFRSNTTSFGVPLDMALFRQWLALYRANPAQCSSGEWVDAGFAKAWYDDNVDRDTSVSELPIPLSSVQLGSIALAFHPSELFSYYGLAIQRESPLPHTIVVGYADEFVGYLADPRSYSAGEYAATVVPKILDFPPFSPHAARQMTERIGLLIQQTIA